MARRRKKMHRVWGEDGADSAEEPTTVRGRVGTRSDLDGWGDPDQAEMSCHADRGFESGRTVYYDEWT